MRVPTPKIETAETHYGACYAWAIRAHGLIIFENTKADCINSFLETYKREYGKPFNGRAANKED